MEDKKQNNNRVAKKGDRIAVSYVCYGEDGSELDNSNGEFETTIGAGDILPALEKALVGMQPGETKCVVLPPSKAFGNRDEDAVEYVALSMLPQDIAEGEMVELLPEDGDDPMQGTVVEIYDDEALVDLNHPMAGLSLHFEVTLSEIL